MTSPGSPSPVRPSWSSSQCSSSSVRSSLGEWKSLHYAKMSRVTLDSQWPRSPQPEALLLFPSTHSPGRRVCGFFSSLTAPAPAYMVAAGTAAEPAVFSPVLSGNPEFRVYTAHCCVPSTTLEGSPEGCTALWRTTLDQSPLGSEAPCSITL